ncbi:endo-1,4-D-glucanase, partial [Salmonella enterica subsp. enterica serovar Heidelberg str. CFSAN002074]
IAREEVVNVPGLGSMLLPGKIGFAEANSWRFNPSYLPPQLAQYFSRFGAPYPPRYNASLSTDDRPPAATMPSRYRRRTRSCCPAPTR